MTAEYFLFSSKLLRLAAVPASRLYEFAVLKRPQPNPEPIGVPVISVGNIHAGGVGKTPLVIALTQWFISEGRRPAVVSRGYRGALSRSGAEVTFESDAIDVGDEPIEIARACPGAKVFIGARRVEACRRAESSADLIILDDGFQHRAVHRDLDIVVAPVASDPLREKLLPLGRLREPLGALDRASLLVLVGEFGDEENFIDGWRKIFAGPIVQISKTLGRTSMLTETPKSRAADFTLSGRTVVAFSGIAHPERFHAALKSAGARIADAYIKPDHAHFGTRDLTAIKTLCDRHHALAVTTSKDSARLHAAKLPFPTAVLSISMDCTALFNAISEKKDFLMRLHPSKSA